MALKIVTGGTTGAADGTLVSSSNKIVFAALDTVVDCHIRADDDTYSADASFSMPSDGAVQVSFDGGSTWKAFADNPASYGVDIGDLNVAIKLRQHATASASTGTFQTDATTPAATAAPNVASLTVTPGASQNVLTWADVANDSGYLIETSANGSTGWSTVTTTASGATSYTHTGLTNGTPYYYRITTVGTGRYKNATTPATGNGTPVFNPIFLEDGFSGSGTWGTRAPDTTGSGNWVKEGAVDGSLSGGYVYLNCQSGTYTPTNAFRYRAPITPSTANYWAEMDIYWSNFTLDANAGVYNYLLVRDDGSGHYYGGLCYTLGSTPKIYSVVNKAGIGLTLPTNANVGSAQSTGLHTFRVEITTTSGQPVITMKFDGTTILTYTDTGASPLLSPGNVSFMRYYDNGIFTNYDNTANGPKIDRIRASV